MDDIPTTVVVIWWIVLALTALIILPLVAYLLHRALHAAKRIDQNAAKALAAGLAVAGNTADIEALDETISTATRISQTATEIETHTGQIATVLASRAERKAT